MRRVVIDENGCWVWQGKLRPDGYGGLRAYNRYWLSHRFAYIHLVGPLPDEFPVLDHLCRNRACCNPDHLEPVTDKINCHRGIAPAAVNKSKERCVHGHPFTPENTRVRRKTRKRDCLTCEWARNNNMDPANVRAKPERSR